MDETKSTKPAYQIEPADLRKKIIERGYIKPWELLKICAWKSAKGLAWVSLNSEESIKSVTSETIESLRTWDGPRNLLSSELSESDWDRWEELVGKMIGTDKRHSKSGFPSGLLQLHGVGYPVATAILAIIEPSLFPVMDKWAVETVFGAGASKRRWQHKAAYRSYTAQLVGTNCRELQKLSTLRQRDIKAMEAGMSSKPLEGFTPIQIPRSS